MEKFHMWVDSFRAPNQPNASAELCSISIFSFQFENCERFWFQPKREDEQIGKIFKMLNSGQSYSRTLAEFDETDDIDPNGVIAAREKRNGSFFRARILGSEYDEVSDSLVYTVFYIDHGHNGQCKLEEMRRLLNNDLQNLPPRCFECRLAELQPAITQSETNDWSQDANDLFHDLIDEADGRVTAEVSRAQLSHSLWACHRE